MIKRTLVLGSLTAVLAFTLLVLSSSDDRIQASHNTTGSSGFAIDMDPSATPANANGAEAGPNCTNSTDDDGDTAINDGCAIAGVAGAAETTCTGAVDEDNDRRPNDGCPVMPPIAGGDNEDIVPGGCNTPEDDDNDGVVNDGCTEGGLECEDSADNDSDGFVNDGCPLIADEAAEDCGTEATDNDGDGAINDGCSAIAIVGTREECAAVNRNDLLDADEDLSPDTIDVDVTIADIPTTRPAISYSYNLSYDPLAMQIINVDSANLLAASAGSSIILAGDFLPDTDGLYFGATADSTVGAAEWGSGALDTLSIEVLDGPAAGGYDLQVYDAAHQDHYSRSMPTAAVNGAWVAVDVTCASLGAAPPPDPVKEGDVDCSNTITPIDALKILRFFAGLAVVQTDPCTDIGVSTTANATAPNPIHIGDVDCSGAVNAVDALKILRFAAGLSVTYIGTCDPLTP